jgi:hypothetical protein
MIYAPFTVSQKCRFSFCFDLVWAKLSRKCRKIEDKGQRRGFEPLTFFFLSSKVRFYPFNIVLNLSVFLVSFKPDQKKKKIFGSLSSTLLEALFVCHLFLQCSKCKRFSPHISIDVVPEPLIPHFTKPSLSAVDMYNPTSHVEPIPNHGWRHFPLVCIPERAFWLRSTRCEDNLIKYISLLLLNVCSIDQVYWDNWQLLWVQNLGLHLKHTVLQSFCVFYKSLISIKVREKLC